MDEKELVTAARGGDRRAFMELYQRYKEMVYAHCYAAVLEKEIARDLFQEIWIKAFVGIRRLRQIETFSAWLKTLTTNTIRDYLRRKRPDFEELSENLQCHTRSLENSLTVRDILRKISSEDRYILFLRFYEGRSFSEISKILDLSESAIKMRIHRLLKRLKETFKE